MVSVSVRYLFHQQMDEKIKTKAPPLFPAKEKPEGLCNNYLEGGGGGVGKLEGGNRGK